MKRRNFFLISSLVGFVPKSMLAAGEIQDPWPRGRLIEPAALAETLAGSGKHPVIISVVFPVLYRQRHIPDAILAGPGSKPEGVASLRKAVAAVPKSADIVIYCGCCPMVRCPNIRPAFQELEDLGYTKVQVLNLPSSFHADWVAKGYPVEPRGGNFAG